MGNLYSILYIAGGLLLFIYLLINVWRRVFHPYVGQTIVITASDGKTFKRTITKMQGRNVTFDEPLPENA